MNFTKLEMSEVRVGSKFVDEGTDCLVAHHPAFGKKGIVFKKKKEGYWVHLLSSDFGFILTE